MQGEPAQAQEQETQAVNERLRAEKITRRNARRGNYDSNDTVSVHSSGKGRGEKKACRERRIRSSMETTRDTRHETRGLGRERRDGR